MLWTPRPGVARNRRVELGLTLEKVSEVSSLSVGSIRRVEAGDAARAETIDALAAALGVTRAALADKRATAPSKKPKQPAPDASEPPRRGVPLRAEELAPPSRLAALIRREEAVGIVPHQTVDGESLPTLTVRAVRSIYTAFALCDGERFVARGKIVDQRGLVAAEAAELGSASGVGARFHLVRPVDAESTFAITAHAVEPKLTRALLSAHESDDFTLVVRVVVSKGGAPVFSAFSTATVLPWTVLVERIVTDAPAKPASAKVTRPPRRRT